MENKSDKELADELDAKKRLKDHGYRQRVCSSCNGASSPQTYFCVNCGGKGYTWEAPLMC